MEIKKCLLDDSLAFHKTSSVDVYPE